MKNKMIIDWLSENSNVDAYFLYLLKNENIENASEIFSILHEGGAFDVEIIYYSVAIEYLKEHDDSLRDSLAIASEMGYEVGSLSSEVLATLLASRKAEDDFWEIEDELNEYIESIEEVEN